MEQKLTSVIIAGAAPDTGNQGVSALLQSAVLGLAERGTESFTLLDNGGDNMAASKLINDPTIQIGRLAFQGGKRIYRSGNMHNARLRQMFGLPSPVLKAIRSADAVLDVSGGDSFTDLYGPNRFDQIICPKEMALSVGTPLILLPQTYGPFKFKKSREKARDIVARSHLAYARDVDSFGHMKDLLGDAFDPARHRLGVDLAFGLPVTAGRPPLQKSVGINVSGLLWNDAEKAQALFDLTADYQQSLQSLCLHILSSSDYHIHLVPHVAPQGSGENDLVACRSLRDQLPAECKTRISLEETATSPSELKEVISQMDWFVGARMHATIAALSTCTPVANMAYSRKSRGVFDRCGAADQVMDMRQMQTEDLTASLINAFENRAHQKQVLTRQLPFVQRAWGFQMDVISAAVKAAAPSQEAAYA